MNDSGSDACLVSFSGINHPEGDPAIWEEDLIEGHLMARSIIEEHGVPFYFLGYSLGALLGQYLLFFKQNQIKFNKQVLLAPATAIGLPRFVKSSISLLNDNLQIRSYTPKGYSIDDWLPAKIYKKMIYWERSIINAGFAHLNIPTLVIIDPKDELISYPKIRRQIRKYGLSNYQCIVLESSLSGRSTRYHHLIIDGATMGKKNWTEVASRIAAFFDP